MELDTGCRLGVDFGTSTTVAMLRWPDGRVRPLLFDGSPLLASAVLLDADGRLHVGRDAEHLARANPHRLEPNPKRRIDDGRVLLADAEVPVVELIAAVLRRVLDEARSVAAEIVDVTVTHPVTWGPARRAVLLEASRRAGLDEPRLLAEPVAAATFFATTRDDGPSDGGWVLVYDLGAGTCDVTLLRRHGQGFDTVASDGLDDVGGLDVDAAIVAHLTATCGELWTDTAGRRRLWDEVRSAKEMLSRASGTVVAVPALGREVPLGREQLEELARPVLAPTAALAGRLLRTAGVDPGAVAGVFLVGGSSRIPLVATLLHAALGIAPSVIEQPELVVAEGSLYTVDATLRPAAPGVSAPAGAVPPVPAPLGSAMANPVPPDPAMANPARVNPAVAGPGLPGLAMAAEPGDVARPVAEPGRVPPSRRRSAVLAAMVAAVVLAALLTATALLVDRDRHDRGGSGRSAAAHRSGDPQRQPSPSGESGHSSSTTAPTSATTTNAAPARFAVDRMPENLCTKVDAGELAKTFEKQGGKPMNARDKSISGMIFSCTLQHDHVENAGTVAFMQLYYQLSVNDEAEFAADVYQRALEHAKLNASSVVEVPGIGERAFIHPDTSIAEDPAMSADYRMGIVESNLTWSVVLTASRFESRAWTDQERERIRKQLIATMKANHSKITAG